MVIGDRLKELRERKDLSQGDIEERAGLLCCYISRVENNHTVPCVETLEKMARALEVPMYKLFYESEEKAVAPKLRIKEFKEWGTSERDVKTLRRFQTVLGKGGQKGSKSTDWVGRDVGARLGASILNRDLTRLGYNNFRSASIPRTLSSDADPAFWEPSSLWLLRYPFQACGKQW
jgi:transcriptional regulator with XRE-family HTH domain